MIVKIKKYVIKYIPKRLRDLLYVMTYRRMVSKDKEIYEKILKGKKGIEIGGPSIIFKDILKVYQVASGLDGVNYSDKTMWEGSISEGFNYKYYNNRVGHQYIRDAVDLRDIDSNKYEFIISSNCLEHVANPIKALNEWKRVVNSNGYILLILPNKKENFDHNRQVTSFHHLLNDFNDNVSEDDLTHIEEILKLHDLSLDLHAGSKSDFEIRCKNNYINRGIHHHVFDMPLILEMFSHLGMNTIHYTITNKDIFVLGGINK